VDIVVTIPKREAQNIAREDEFVAQMQGHAVQFWSIHNKPKNLIVGDRVYFVENGYITCYHIFIGYVYDPVCEVTGRLWSGLNLLLRCPQVKLENPVPMKGFQGFRYIERIE